MAIRLNKHDEYLAEKAIKMIDSVVKEAHFSAAVAKRITTRAMYWRNKGRGAAMRRHPFSGICEAGGLPLKKEDKHLDELDPEKGYQGRVRWVCPKANNSGKKSCGGC